MRIVRRIADIRRIRLTARSDAEELQHDERPAPHRDPRNSKVSLTDLLRMKRDGEKITAVTAYDALSGRLADHTYSMPEPERKRFNA